MKDLVQILKLLQLEDRIEKQELTEERRDTIMKIWDATTTRFGVLLLGNRSHYWAKPNSWWWTTFLRVDKSKYDRNHAWTRLQQISNMTKSEYVDEWKKQDREDTEEDTETEEGEDDRTEEESES